MRNKLWARDEQTAGKHLILKHYLDGWLPILSSWSGRLLIIDGFAGPGEHEGGEPGSPLIAMERVNEHKQAGRLENTDVFCLFIESDDHRAQHLHTLLRRQRRESGVEYQVLSGTFDDHMTHILDYVDEQKAQLAPAFVMIDPFGVKGSPMNLIERILSNEKSECMISFMYEPIRRFHQQSEYEPHLNELFGTQEWKKCFAMQDSGARKKFLHRLFSQQLKEHGAQYVVPFELWRGNRHVYTIYFTSGSLKGCDLMKQAMWKVEPSGSYAFRGDAGQVRMPIGEDTVRLAEELKNQFEDELTSIELIEEYVMSDETIFHKGHLRRKTLQPLERDGRITVIRPHGVRGFPNNRGIKVIFH